jgi:uncharacterized protein YycO
MNTDHLKTCDILLYKGKSFNSKLIQWGTGSEFSHVAVVVDPTKFLAIESNTGHQSGVRALDLRKADETIITTLRIKGEHVFDARKTLSFLVAHLGAKFDTLGVTWLGVLKVFSKIPGVKAKANKFQKEKDYFCSELCYQAFLEGGLDIVPEVPDAEVTSPGDIANSSRLEVVSQLVHQ